MTIAKLILIFIFLIYISFHCSSRSTSRWHKTSAGADGCVCIRTKCYWCTRLTYRLMAQDIALVVVSWQKNDTRRLIDDSRERLGVGAAQSSLQLTVFQVINGDRWEWDETRDLERKLTVHKVVCWCVLGRREMCLCKLTLTASALLCSIPQAVRWHTRTAAKAISATQEKC